MPAYHVDPEARDALLEKLRDGLRPHQHALIAAYLFGSTARGQAGPFSDIDLALLLAQEPEPGLSGMGFDVAYELELALGRAVDVVVINRASADLVHRVLRDGILLYEGDRKARVAFEVRARATYFDLAPLRRLYRLGGAPASKSSGTNSP